MVTKREIVELSKEVDDIANSLADKIAEAIRKQGIPVPSSTSMAEIPLISRLVDSVETAYGIWKWKELNLDYEVTNVQVLKNYYILKVLYESLPKSSDLETLTFEEPGPKDFIN